MDGAHNPAAIRQLAEAVPEYFQYRRLILVLGMMADKDIPSMMGTIAPLAAEVVLTRPSLPRAADPEDLAAHIRRVPGFSGLAHVEGDMGRALNLALRQAARDDAVLVTGSLYTVSDARAHRVASTAT